MRGLPFYVKREAFARADIRQRVAYILSAVLPRMPHIPHI